MHWIVVTIIAAFFQNLRSSFQKKINKDVFDDVSRIISFISVDGASNAALIQNEFITSFPQVDAISIQRL